MERSAQIERKLLPDEAMNMTYPDLTISRPLPKNVKDTEIVFFERLLVQKIDSPEIINVRNSYVFDKGVVFKNFFPIKKLLHRNDHTYFQTHTKKDLVKSFLLNRIEHLSKSETYLLITNLYSSSYYHWLIEAMPRLFLIKDLIHAGVVLLPQDCRFGFHNELLEIFATKSRQIMQPQIAYAVRKLVSPTEIGKMANSHPLVLQDSVAFVKKRIALTLSMGEKVYVSRQRAAKRKVYNESDITDYLKTQGFAILCLEDFKFVEQVSIIHHCRYLVGLHGAGLSNLVFMNKGASLFELRKHDKGENYFFFTLSSAMDINYYYQFCTGINEQGSVQDDDVFVSLEEFKRNICQMLKEE